MGILSRLFILIHWFSFIFFLFTGLYFLGEPEEAFEIIFYNTYIFRGYSTLFFYDYVETVSFILVTGFWIFILMPFLIWVLFNKFRILPSSKPLTKIED